MFALIGDIPTEIRRALEQLGEGAYLNAILILHSHDEEKLIQSVSKAVQYMAKRRIGALIVLKRKLDCKTILKLVYHEFCNISRIIDKCFIPNTPLHDGAMIIQNTKIASAACYLPLSDSNKISKSLGTRHGQP